MPENFNLGITREWILGGPVSYVEDSYFVTFGTCLPIVYLGFDSWVLYFKSFLGVTVLEWHVSINEDYTSSEV